MTRKFLAKLTITAALGLVIVAATAASAMADSGSGIFGYASVGLGSDYGSLSISTAHCNLSTHRATFTVSVATPTRYASGIWFSDIVYARDVSANGPWVNNGQVTLAFNTVRTISPGVTISQPTAFSNTSFQGIAGHTYQFMVYFNWAPFNGSWQGWQYLNVGPFTWDTTYGPISGYQYCRL